jgi:branched-chain amino acid transport system substrate-binding protein
MEGGMQMRRSTVVVVLFVSLVALFSATFIIFDSTEVVAAESTPIKIGGSLPLTGIHAETAKWLKEGYEFWAEEINRRGGLLGRPVKLIIYDDQSNPHNALSHYEKAITVEKVDLIFGGYPAPVNVTVMPLAEKYGMVYINTAGQMKAFQQGFTYSFASPPLIGEWTYLSLEGILNELIPKEQWPKSMALLTMNNVVGLSAKENLLKTAGEHGIKVVVDEVYNLPLTDITPLVSKAKASGAELLFCMSFFDDGVMITRTAKSIGYSPKLLFQILASTIPAWLKEMGQEGDAVVGQMWWNSRLPFEGNSVLNEAAKARFGLPEAPAYFGLGYCSMKTLELGVIGAGTLDQKAVRDLLKSRKFDLPYAKGITFDQTGLPQPFAYATQTVGGRVELVWPKEVATTNLIYPRPQWK